MDQVSAQLEYALTGEWLTACDLSDLRSGCAPNDLRPFVFPTGIGIDSLNHVYVVDTWKKEVQKFTSDGEFLTKWGTPGNGDGQFRTPTGIAVDSLDNVYITDLSLDNVQKFTSNGEFLTEWGTPGNGDGQFRTPTGIAVDSLDNVYVVDTSLSNIQKFTSDGEFITKWGKRGTDAGRFLNPKGVAIDPSSNIYVVDQLNNRIQKFANNGDFITMWGSKCPNIISKTTIFDYVPYSCIHPSELEFLFPNGGIAVDSSANIYALDQLNNRIQKFTSDGEFVTSVPLPDYRGKVQTSSFLGHSDVEVDAQGRLFLTSQNDKVLIFSGVCSEIYHSFC